MLLLLNYNHWATISPHNHVYTIQVVLNVSVAHLAVSQCVVSELCYRLARNICHGPNKINTYLELLPQVGIKRI